MTIYLEKKILIFSRNDAYSFPKKRLFKLDFSQEWRLLISRLFPKIRGLRLTFLKQFLLLIWKLNYKAVETYTNGCPSTHPYVYGRGKYCCSSFEFSEWVDKGLSGHIGRSFSNCRGAYTTCPHGENCVDFNQIQIGKRTALKAGKLMTHLTYKLLI